MKKRKFTPACGTPFRSHDTPLIDSIQDQLKEAQEISFLACVNGKYFYSSEDLKKYVKDEM